MNLFISDNQNINLDTTKIMPNYPPFGWNDKLNEKTSINCLPLKIVYVGSTSLDTMYFPEFFAWVEMQAGKVLFDIYSFSYNVEFVNYVKKINCPFINLKEKLIYSNLPLVLSNYHVGTILYKAHIQNVKYCASNKLFEYMSSGKPIISTVKMGYSILEKYQLHFPSKK